ncbi:putative transcription factor interactor and regulator LisH family [Arabidopsis thaliana]
METPKIVVTSEDWESKLSDVEILIEDMNRLVMNLLVAEGYREAAEKFKEESITMPEEDLASMNERLEVIKAIESRNLEDAIEKLNALNPEIIKTSFHLHQQMLIELIREKKTEEAVAFAQEKLAPLAEENALQRELEKTVCILVTEGLPNCPSRELFHNSQWIRTASHVNEAIHTSQTGEKGPELERLLKELIWTQNQLDEKTVYVYPRMNDFSTGQLIYRPE